MRSYAIPRTYCERRIRLSAENIQELISAASPCEFTLQDDRAWSVCRLSTATADRIIQDLKNIGTMTSYSQNCEPPRVYPELEYKRDHLRREWEQTSLSSSNAPAISGLLEAQLMTLDRIISAQEAAEAPILRIAITRDEAGGPFVPEDGLPWPDTIGPIRGAPRARKLPMASERTRNWTRRPISICDQLKAILVVYKNSQEPEAADRLDSIRALGEPYSDLGCELLARYSPRLMIFSTLPEEEIRKKLIELPGFVSWRLLEPEEREDIVTDDVRFKLLTAELSFHANILKRAPHIRGLVEAEIERVRASAEALERLKKGRLILIQFAG